VLESAGGAEPRRAARTASTGAGPGDLERLERAVSGLLSRYASLRRRNDALERRLAERDRRVGELEGEVARLERSRRDVARRVGDLIEQIDRLEGRLSSPAQAD
jgi:chromosome segregation ATPase